VGARIADDSGRWFGIVNARILDDAPRLTQPIVTRDWGHESFASRRARRFTTWTPIDIA
jgi:hypothetical protein